MKKILILILLFSYNLFAYNIYDNQINYVDSIYKSYDNSLYLNYDFCYYVNNLNIITKSYKNNLISKKDYNDLFNLNKYIFISFNNKKIDIDLEKSCFYSWSNVYKAILLKNKINA